MAHEARALHMGSGLLGLYGLGWLAVFVDVGLTAGTFAALIVVLAWCAGFAWLGPRHPLAVGVLLVTPCAFPIGFLLAAFSGASSPGEVALALVWFIGVPAVTGLVFLFDAARIRRNRRARQAADIQLRPQLPPRRSGG